MWKLKSGLGILPIWSLMLFLSTYSFGQDAGQSTDLPLPKDSISINGALQVFTTQIDLKAFLDYLPKQGATWTELETQGLKQNFQKFPQNLPPIAHKETYWFTFEVSNPKPAPAEWVLFTGYEQRVEIYGLREEKYIGTMVPDQEKKGNLAPGLFLRDEGYSGQVLIQLAPNESRRLYIRSKRVINNPMRFDFKIYPRAYWGKITQPPLRHFGQGFFQGIIWALILYHLIFFLMVRDLTYVYYSIYMICISMLTLGDFGYWQGYLFKQQPYLGWGLFLFLQYFTGIMTFVFMQKFVQLQRLMPKWNQRVTRFIWANIGLLLLLSLLYLLFQDYQIVQFGKLLIAPFALFGVIFCYLLIRSRDTVALYFAIAGLVFSLAILINGVLQVLNERDVLLQTPYVRYYILQVAAVAHLMTFSVGMGFRRRQMDLEQQKVLELDELKTRLYTNITHEFRTPLTVIMGMTEQIKGFPEATKLIQRNSQNLLRLINQLLDLSKLEAGKLSFKFVNGNIVNYLQYLTESFHSMAEAKNINLTFYSEEPVINMDFDEEKVQHIVYNLLSNAIKFTPEKGKIVFHVSTFQEKQNAFLKLSIQDSGEGISSEKLPHIFERFYQADASSTRHGEGTGIGLALTKELIEQMNGRIQVQSKIDQGSTFTVFLPQTQETDSEIPSLEALPKITPQIEPGPDFSQKEDQQIASDKDLDKPLLLLIEDNPDVQFYIKELLREDYQIHTADHGEKGIELALEIVPDIIISDVMMPQKNGYEVCDRLKQDERTSHIPIILLTAKATQEDKLQGLKYGADAYLAKPFDPKELNIRLENLVDLRRQLQRKFTSSGTNFSESTETTEPSLEDEFIQKVRTQIHENLHEASFSVPQLASLLHLSHTQLYRKLKALTDQTPSQFIRTIRLQKAAELLNETDLNISEIAYDVGFTDPNYFSRAFQQAYKKSPSDFRK